MVTHSSHLEVVKLIKCELEGAALKTVEGLLGGCYPRGLLPEWAAAAVTALALMWDRPLGLPPSLLALQWRHHAFHQDLHFTPSLHSSYNHSQCASSFIFCFGEKTKISYLQPGRHNH